MGTTLYCGGSRHGQAQPRPRHPENKKPRHHRDFGADWRRAYFLSPQQPEEDSDEQQEPAEPDASPQHADSEQQAEPQQFLKAT